METLRPREVFRGKWSEFQITISNLHKRSLMQGEHLGSHETPLPPPPSHPRLFDFLISFVIKDHLPLIAIQTSRMLIVMLFAGSFG